jgi:hypothetical protein
MCKWPACTSIDPSLWTHKVKSEYDVVLSGFLSGDKRFCRDDRQDAIDGAAPLHWLFGPPSALQNSQAPSLAGSAAAPAARRRIRRRGALMAYPLTDGHDVALFRLDVCLANDAAEIIILLTKKNREIGAARPDREITLFDQLRLDFGRLHRRH